MAQAIRVAINGATGRMGSALLALVRADNRFALSAALVSPASAHRNRPVFLEAPDAMRFTSEWADLAKPDVLIDFSGPEGLAAALDFCITKNVALVTGTTGIDEALQKRLVDASKTIAVLQAANFSLGVAVLSRLLREAAASLADWDLEIVESHHHRKEDAPSGTALALGEAAAQARGKTLAEEAVYSREGRPGARKSGTIGFAVVRGGDVVGDHVALLLGAGERLELGHRATDRSIFARGALEAAAWLSAQPAGFYAIDDVLKNRKST